MQNLLDSYVLFIAVLEVRNGILNQIRKEIEIKMATDFYLSGLAKDVQLTRTEKQFQGGDSPLPTGAARMTWNVVTTTIEGVPDVVT